MDATVHKTLNRLKVLAKIESGQNLMVGSTDFHIFDSKKSTWDRFLKWWLGENRTKTTDKLNNFYLEIKNLITALTKEPQTHSTNIDRLLHELTLSLNGLDKLMETYQKDMTIISQLETLKENFQLEMERLIKSTPPTSPINIPSPPLTPHNTPISTPTYPHKAINPFETPPSSPLPQIPITKTPLKPPPHSIYESGSNSD